MEPTKAIIAHGDVSEGYSFIGPFEDYDAAIQYAEVSLRGEEWTVCTLWTTEADDAG